ncbi:MAG: DNA recombination protein RecN [Arcobacter sp.]|nr:DNA recombination protein RecN [Arcobacter sp.]
MIDRFYLEDYLSFQKVELNFKNGLIIFSGPSGAGKSILFNSIVSLFGAKDSKAKISEINLINSKIKNDDYLIEDDFSIKQTTLAKTRYFLNNQVISKNDLHEFSKSFFKHLHLKDTSDFDSENIIEFLDFLGYLKFENYKLCHIDFQNIYKDLKEIKLKLQKIYKDEKDIENLKEFAKFEIEKISKINPKDGEYEELKELKDMLSKKDKVEKILSEAKPFLVNTHKISQALDILEVNSSFFDDAINEINNQFEKFYDKIEAVEYVNIEDEFNRLRLALMTARSIYECDTNGILFLDEIDANLSGKESESIAKVLKKLSLNYQIFAISHQPQLSSTANQHFLVEKKDDISYVKELNNENRIVEISRMISGEHITEEARTFAKILLGI